MEHTFPFEIFYPEKHLYRLFQCSPEINFSLQQPKQLCFIYIKTGFSGNLLQRVNNPETHPDVQYRVGGGRAGLKKNIFQPFRPQFGLKISHYPSVVADNSFWMGLILFVSFRAWTGPLYQASLAQYLISNSLCLYVYEKTGWASTTNVTLMKIPWNIHEKPMNLFSWSRILQLSISWPWFRTINFPWIIYLKWNTMKKLAIQFMGFSNVINIPWT